MSGKIMVVDDEESVRILLKDNFEAEGFQVVLAETGKQALESAWKANPDLAVVDIGLPDMSGWEVCKRLKTDFRTSGMKLVILTAEVVETVKSRMKELGLEHYILKPSKPEKIVGQVKSVLASKTGAAAKK